MSLNLSAIAIRERAVTLFFILLLAAAGGYAFFMLGRAEDPNFTIKTLTVTTAWPGATAREMQDLVVEPLEKRLQELTWYDRVETSTRPGYAYMTLTLKDSTPPSLVQEEFYQARKKLGDEARNLPPGVLGPFVNDEYSDVSFALYALKAKGMPMRELARQAEVIRQDLLHVPGVKKINILGERPEQIFVDFSYAKLATLGVSARVFPLIPRPRVDGGSALSDVRVAEHDTDHVGRKPDITQQGSGGAAEVVPVPARGAGSLLDLFRVPIPVGQLR
jgi:multidrug efflux pump subunit AcrB